MTVSRPQLAPASRRLWRDRETLQLGRTPGRAVVLAGVDALVRTFLGLLDGTKDRQGLLNAAAQSGCPPDQAERTLQLLEGAGLLEDAALARPGPPTLERGERDRLHSDLLSLQLLRPGSHRAVAARRGAARIVVLGAGRVGAPIALLLASSGIGAVDVVDEGTARPEDCGVGGLRPDQVGLRRGDAARALVQQLAPSVRTTTLVLPDVVVLAPAAGLPTPEAPPLVPHLLAEVRDGTGVVGPLVRPGSACLRCLDHERTDRDPDWPALAAQLSLPARGVTACDAVLAIAVAAQAVHQVLGLVDGDARPASVGGTLELALPDWRWRRRSWQIHPACDCQWRGTG